MKIFFLTQISCGTKTKCRKTRAKLADYTILECIALKQLRHLCGSRHLFAKKDISLCNIIIAYVRLISGIAIVYRFNQSNFLTQISCGTKTKRRKTRAMLTNATIKIRHSAQTLRPLAVRVKPISYALQACFLGHYRMARMSQSASSCGLASWMRPHVVPDTYLLKLLFIPRYNNCSFAA